MDSPLLQEIVDSYSAGLLAAGPSRVIQKWMALRVIAGLVLVKPGLLSAATIRPLAATVFTVDGAVLERRLQLKTL